jgi:hypothetical protein
MAHDGLLFALESGRRLQRELLGDLPAEALTVIPEGWRNHLLWHIGHLTLVQQALIYGMSGTPMPMDGADFKHFMTWFGRDSSPLDWKQVPEAAHVLELHDRLWRSMGDDLAAERFQGYRPYATAMGVTISTVEEALAFNNVHEGIHYGLMLRLKHAVSAA